MSLQSAALQYAIDNFDTIWEKAIPYFKEHNVEYCVVILAWKNNQFNLSFNIESDAVYDYNDRNNVFLFSKSYYHEFEQSTTTETKLKEEQLYSLKNQLQKLKKIEQEINKSETITPSITSKNITLFLDSTNGALYTKKELEKIYPLDRHNIITITKTIDNSDMAIPINFGNYHPSFSYLPIASTYKDLPVTAQEVIYETLELLQNIKDNPEDIIKTFSNHEDTFKTDLSNIFSRWLIIAIDNVTRELLKEKQPDIHLNTILHHQNAFKECLYENFVTISVSDIENENFTVYENLIHNDIVYKKLLNYQNDNN